MAERKTAPRKAASSGESESKLKPEVAEKVAFQRKLFFTMALDMSWQLAVVVIVPIVGGYYLDQYFHTFPGLLIAGLLLAMLGMVLVMIKTLNEVNRRTGGKK